MNLWERDAERAGQIDRGDKSYVAMLAARCVEAGTGGPRETGKNFPVRPSVREFAERAGISHPTVAAYLRTWDALAADGWVPSRDSLSPGDEDVADLPDRETWNKYYRVANPQRIAATPQPDPTPEPEPSEFQRPRFPKEHPAPEPHPTDDLSQWHGEPQADDDRELTRIIDSMDRLTRDLYEIDKLDIYKFNATLRAKTITNLEIVVEMTLRKINYLREFDNE